MQHAPKRPSTGSGRTELGDLEHEALHWLNPFVVSPSNHERPALKIEGREAVYFANGASRSNWYQASSGFIAPCGARTPKRVASSPWGAGASFIQS